MASFAFVSDLQRLEFSSKRLRQISAPWRAVLAADFSRSLISWYLASHSALYCIHQLLEFLLGHPASWIIGLPCHRLGTLSLLCRQRDFIAQGHDLGISFETRPRSVAAVAHRWSLIAVFDLSHSSALASSSSLALSSDSTLMISSFVLSIFWASLIVCSSLMLVRQVATAIVVVLAQIETTGLATLMLPFSNQMLLARLASRRSAFLYFSR